MGPRAGLDGRKISSPPGFDPGPSSPWSVAIPTELPGLHLSKQKCINIVSYTITYFSVTKLTAIITVSFVIKLWPPISFDEVFLKRLLQCNLTINLPCCGPT